MTGGSSLSGFSVFEDDEPQALFRKKYFWSRKLFPELDVIRPFGCEFCESKSKRQEHLKRHVKSLHIGENLVGAKYVANF